MKRVVVTGMGVISPIGNDLESFWHNLIEGNSGISPIDGFDCENFRCQVAGQIRDELPDFNIDNEDLINRLKKTDRSTQYLMCAMDQALKCADLDKNDLDIEDTAVILGQTVGGVINGERVLKKIAEGDKNVSKDLYFNTAIDSLLYWTHECFGVSGFADVISTGCAAGTDAIGCAYQMIQSGECDIAIAGGTEAPISKLTLEAFDVIGALAKADKTNMRASAPFSANRTGFVASEGAGAVILESFEHAQRRGANIYAEVNGYYNNSNAYHMTAPSPDGMQLARCIRQADISLNNETEYINTHGSSTQLNDVAETKAVLLAFGEKAYDLSLNSNKSVMGHPIGAAGALEFITCVMAINNNTVPPTINYIKRDPDCDLDYTPNVLRNRKIDHAMSISSGFGGVNCALALSSLKECI